MFSADGLDSLEESLKVLGLNSDAATFQLYHLGPVDLSGSRLTCKALGGLSVCYTVKSVTECEKAKENGFELIIFDSCIL